jgi:hypothetical protein
MICAHPHCGHAPLSSPTAGRARSPAAMRGGLIIGPTHEATLERDDLFASDWGHFA